MAGSSGEYLSRRERQIMDIVYTGGRASVGEVLNAMADPPSYSAVRALMRILGEKGHLKHKKVGNKYIYLPTRSRRDAGRFAVRRVLKTFFGGSAERVMAALLETSETRLSDEELDRLTELISKAKKEGR